NQIELKTAPADFRFPTTNQTRHCFTRYIEFHRYSCSNVTFECTTAKGEDSNDCERFAKYYRALCPGEWVCLCSATCLSSFIFLHPHILTMR
ncbi:unnamed protein product, partial [Brassica oleracea]